MGCCMSAEEPKIYEVVLDHNGVARRVPLGQGTHLIFESPFKETRMEQKTDYTLPSTLSSLPRPLDTVYRKAPKIAWSPTPPRRVGVSPITDEKEPSENKP